MNRQKCDECGNWFEWQKGMAYCSYECEEKVRKRQKRQQDEYWEKVKKETVCPECGGIGVDIERYNNDDKGFIWETYYKCKKCGRKKMDVKWNLQKAKKGDRTMQEIKWQKPDVLPEKDDHIIIKFYNDLGVYHAAGLFYLTSDTNEPVFCDVLAGHIYDWNTLVIMWAKL